MKLQTLPSFLHTLPCAFVSYHLMSEPLEYARRDEKITPVHNVDESPGLVDDQGAIGEPRAQPCQKCLPQIILGLPPGPSSAATGFSSALALTSFGSTGAAEEAPLSMDWGGSPPVGSPPVSRAIISAMSSLPVDCADEVSAKSTEFASGLPDSLVGAAGAAGAFSLEGAEADSFSPAATAPTTVSVPSRGAGRSSPGQISCGGRE